MDPRVRKHAGVEMRPLREHLQGNHGLEPKGDKPSSSFVRWNCLFMGMRPSPYNAVRYYYWGEEFARGDRSTPTNPMGYDEIRLNLPGMAEYDPTLPKVMKWSTLTNTIAADVITFVDDGWVPGSSKENCHRAHRQFASRIQYLGMQDAPRKFRPPSQTNAGAWTGTIFKVTPSSIVKTVTTEKWNKGKILIRSLMVASQSEQFLESKSLDRKELERITGFLNHLAMTFEDITPFLKGFYLTLNSWRDKRNDDGWKVPDNTWLRLVMNRHDRGLMSDIELDQALDPSDAASAPKMVQVCTRFPTDLSTLSRFFDLPDLPAVSIRTKNIITVVYGFGDASGSGLGATFTNGTGFSYRVGVWGPDDAVESSNWKEFTNIVDSSLEDEASSGNLQDSEVFMFTDNATVEACAEKGTSSSPKLLELVVRLRLLSSKVGIKMHIFHVSGTRMIAQGTDGVSRGFLAAGIMDGKPMESFIPIDLSVSDRSPSFIDWVKGWSSPKATLLNPMGWFEEGHNITGWTKGFDGLERITLANEASSYGRPHRSGPMSPWQNFEKQELSGKPPLTLSSFPDCAPPFGSGNFTKRAILYSEFPRGRSKCGLPKCMNLY